MEVKKVFIFKLRNNKYILAFCTQGLISSTTLDYDMLKELYEELKKLFNG